ncbi:MAG: hypothetical protein JNN15_06145 [Blastocatellia bacterium]|nr:hypothetical protein [Blastocatellia bacterium]
MNFDDIRNQWTAFDKKLDNSLKLNALLLREISLSKTSSSLRRLSLGIAFELALNFLILIFLGNFIWTNLSYLNLVIPAITLDIFTISLVYFCVRQLVSLNSIDFSQPVLTNQKRLESLKVMRIYMTKLIFLVSPLLWVPLLIVVTKTVTGSDPYAIFSTSWLAVNFLFGLAVIPTVFWLSKHYSHKFKSSPLIQALLNDIAGDSLTQAITFLQRLSDFEH